MRQGMLGPAAQLWRKHSKNCPACKSEIYILETLCRQAHDSRQHISASAYGNLLSTVNQLYGNQKRPGWLVRFRQFSCKALALAALLLLLFKLAAPLQKMAGAAKTGDKLHSFSYNAGSSDTFQAGTEQGLIIAAQSNDETSPKPEYLPLEEVFEDISGNSLEKGLQELRSSVSDKIHLYGDLLDLELGGEF